MNRKKYYDIRTTTYLLKKKFTTVVHIYPAHNVWLWAFLKTVSGTPIYSLTPTGCVTFSLHAKQIICSTQFSVDLVTTWHRTAFQPSRNVDFEINECVPKVLFVIMMH